MDFARNERGFCVGFAWNLIPFSFVREREGYKHHADCTVHVYYRYKNIQRSSSLKPLGQSKPNFIGSMESMCL